MRSARVAAPRRSRVVEGARLTPSPAALAASQVQLRWRLMRAVRGGGRTWARTKDPLIKSQLLYQLSYASMTGWGEAAAIGSAPLASAPARMQTLFHQARPRGRRRFCRSMRHQDAEAQQHRHLRRAAKADQRQRDADHRRQPHHHRQVDRDVEEDRRRQPRRGQLGEAALRALADARRPSAPPG